MPRRFTYTRISAAQFQQGLNDLGMPDGYKFARLSGFGPTKVRRWIGGQEDVQHAATLILALLSLPGAMEMAEALFEKMATREPDPVGPIGEKLMAAQAKS